MATSPRLKEGWGKGLEFKEGEAAKAKAKRISFVCPILRLGRRDLNWKQEAREEEKATNSTNSNENFPPNFLISRDAHCSVLDNTECFLFFFSYSQPKQRHNAKRNLQEKILHFLREFSLNSDFTRNIVKYRNNELWNYFFLSFLQYPFEREREGGGMKSIQVS